MAQPSMTTLTSVYGSFRAQVLAARLSSSGFDVQLRGAVQSPYALNFGEMARVDVLVPEEQATDASFVLLVDEVDEADVILDDDAPPFPAPRPRWRVWVALAVLGTIGMQILHAVHRVFLV